MKFTILFLAGAVTALGACSNSTEWRHPNTGVASVDQDLQFCSTMNQNIAINLTAANEHNAAIASANPESPALYRRPVDIPNIDHLTTECMWARGNRGGVDHRAEYHRAAR